MSDVPVGTVQDVLEWVGDDPLPRLRPSRVGRSVRR
jgi:hypothetical protein